MHQHSDTSGDGAPVDPVCGMTVASATEAATRSHEGVTYFFCSDSCTEEFDANPAAYVKN